MAGEKIKRFARQLQIWGCVWLLPGLATCDFCAQKLQQGKPQSGD